MQQALHQLESDIARLQIELRQIRQLISSLINHEQDTTNLMNRQLAGNQPQLQQQFVTDQLAQPSHYDAMRNIADRMNGQLTSINTFMHPSGAGTPVYRNNAMQPIEDDPMQRQF